ncbi:MAG TPA: type II toxin-antitoxin system RelE/ParE family toxin [Chitinophagaceae bacterium]|jgi:plasmid stabilization system protein ParE
MEKKIVVSKRFRKNTLSVYEYLIKEYSAKAAFNFIDELQQRVELIIQYPEIGKPSQKKGNVRSVTLQPYNRIYYRLNKNRIELLCLFDMRKKKLPY